MLKWFIIGTLLYYAVLLWRYRDSLGTWFTGGKKQPEQPKSKPTVKAGNGDCLVGASRYRVGQMRTNGDILGHLSKGGDNASIFVPQSDEAVEETPDNKQVEDENTDTLQAIETEFEMEFEAENVEETDVLPNEIEAEEIACYMGDGEPEMAQGITLGELGQMVQVIQIKQASETEERQAVQTICRTKQTCFIRWWNRLTGAGHGWRNFYKSMRYPCPPPSRLPEIMKWQTLT